MHCSLSWRVTFAVAVLRSLHAAFKVSLVGGGFAVVVMVMEGQKILLGARALTHAAAAAAIIQCNAHPASSKRRQYLPYVVL